MTSFASRPGGKTMKSKISLALAAAALAFTIPASRADDAALAAAVTGHIATAAAAAKADQLGPLGLCKTAPPHDGPSFMENYNALKKDPPLEPMQVMDDLYFLG